MKEISAPAGYELSGEAFTVTVKGADVSANATDQPITVKLTVVKQDSETLEATPQGGASLDGVERELDRLPVVHADLPPGPFGPSFCPHPPDLLPGERWKTEEREAPAF